jgi:two-component system, NarL family, sensor kinase
VATDPTTEPSARAEDPPTAMALGGSAPRWVTLSGRTGSEPSGAPLSSPRLLTQLLLGVLVVLCVVGLLGALAAWRLAEREAVNDAASLTNVLAEAVIQPAMSDELLSGSPEAVRAMDSIVRERVLGPSVVRVKLWSAQGRVLYADEPALIGRTFALSQEQRDVLASPKTEAEVSDLSRPENEFETGDRLLEVYRPVWTPSGAEVLFEVYAPYETVGQRAAQLARGFAGVTLSSLLLLVVLMAPIVWHLSQRLRRAQGQRELLLERAVDASAAERRRIAGSLHDGPVQELAAASFTVAGAAARAEAIEQGPLADDLHAAASGVRSSIRALRSLLVDIYPPSLLGSGVVAALTDLAQSVRAPGLRVQLDLPAADSPDAADQHGLSAEQQRLVYRVAQECVRNAAKHAAPCTVAVSLVRENDTVTLDVVDDGCGFDPVHLERTPDSGHFGLSLMSDAATDAGALLQVASAPGHGTHWRLVVPVEERVA